MTGSLAVAHDRRPLPEAVVRVVVVDDPDVRLLVRHELRRAGMIPSWITDRHGGPPVTLSRELDKLDGVVPDVDRWGDRPGQ